MDLGEASLNSVTIRQASLTEVLDLAVQHGFGHVALWRDTYAGVGAQNARLEADTRGLGISSVCRAGMFPHVDERARRRQADDNHAAVEEAAELSAACLVLVCGGVIGRDITGARHQIDEGIAALLPVAEQAGVRLAVEPMHPMMAADRSAITSLAEANGVVGRQANPSLGIALDAYHVWWDFDVDEQIRRAGDSIMGVQVSDWTLPIRDQLSSRGMPGEGCIDLPSFLATARTTGFTGPVEIEVLNADNWTLPAADVARRAAHAMASL